MVLSNYGFGQLNKVDKENGENFKNNDPLAIARKANQKYYTPNVLSDQGPLYAICLSIEPQVQAPPSSWAYGSLRDNFANNKVWFACRARIPEYHSCFPDPLYYGEENEPSINTLHINMHPVFLSFSPIEKLGTELPQPGDIIQVDYQNRSNLQGPIFIKKVIEGELKSENIRTGLNAYQIAFRDGIVYGPNGGRAGRGIITNQQVIENVKAKIDNNPNSRCKNLTDEELLNEAAYSNGNCLGAIKVFGITGNQNRGLVKEAQEKFELMYAAALRDEIDIRAGSRRHTWRSMQDQIDLRNDPMLVGKNGKPLAGIPGESDHQKGVAVDIPAAKPRNGASTTLAYEWLRANAKKYDFYQTVSSEEWHWEYRPGNIEYIIQREDLKYPPADPPMPSTDRDRTPNIVGTID